MVGRTEDRRREVRKRRRNRDLTGEKILCEARRRWQIRAVTGNFCCCGRARNLAAPFRARWRG